MFIAEFTSSELTKCGPEDVAETSNSTREIAVSKLSMLIADEIWSMYRVASCSVFDQIGITKLRCATRHWPWSYNFFLCKLRRSNIVCSCHKSENTINENNFFLRYSVTFLPSLSCIFFCQFLYVFCCSMLQVIIIVFLFFKYVIVLLGNVIFLFLLVVSSECGACVTPGRKWICRRYEKSAPATVAQRNVCKSKAALKTVTMTNQ